MPNFEDAIRKRPLAVQNEGATDSFVTCSFTSQPGLTSVAVDFTNNNDGVRIMSCTGVAGHVGFGPTQFIVKNVLIQPDGGMGVLTWVAADFLGGPTVIPSSTFSISCNVQPGLAINRSRVEFIEDVGT